MPDHAPSDSDPGKTSDLAAARPGSGPSVASPPDERPEPPFLSDAARVCERGDTIGPYRLIDLIGEGGFGEVWLAEQLHPIARRVALKVIKRGMDTRAVIARFEAERQALALMSHPNIARVFDAGTTPAGTPYFVMEHIKGESIARYCDRHRLTIRERLELFEQVCDAVQHAHMKGIIHRDIKPSNILVTIAESGEGGPRPVVIDFGVAKALAQRLTERTIFTERGQMIGTPAYMSPEQAEMAETDIDTRSDVYSLGVVLYELLTGAPPFDPAELRRLGYDAFMKIIRDIDPPRPSTRLSSMGKDGTNAATARGAEVRELSTQLRSELEWIPLKAMRKDRAERYRSAAELGDDIGNYLAKRPLIAGPETTGYKLKKFVRRNKGAVSAVGVIALVLIGGVAGTSWGLVRAVRERATAVKERDQATRINDFMQEVFEGVGPAVAGSRDTAVLRELMDKAAKRIADGELRDAPEAEFGLRLTIGRVYRDIAAYDEAAQVLEPVERLARALHAEDPDGDWVDIAEALDSKAFLLAALGRPAEAEPIYAEVLERYQRIYSGDHAAVATTLNHLAAVRNSLRRPAEAEKLFEQALEMHRRLYKGDHSAVAAGLNNLANVRLEGGRAAAAEPLYTQAMEMHRRLFKGDHPAVATSLNNVARVRQELGGRAKEVESLFARVLEMRQRLYKDDHPDVALSLSNLAYARLDLGHAAEAEPLFVQELEMTRRLRAGAGGDHPDVASSLASVASIRLDLGRAAEAEPMCVEALAMNRRMLNVDQAVVATNLSNLARARHALGSGAEATALFDEAVTMLRRLDPKGSVNLARVLWRSASARLDNGQLTEAMPQAEEALAMAERLLAADHPHVAQYRETLDDIRAALKTGKAPGDGGGGK